MRPSVAVLVLLGVAILHVVVVRQVVTMLDRHQEIVESQYWERG